MTKLKKKLIETGIKQKWLAQRSGLNESILNLIITGRYNPDGRQKKKISLAMSMREAELFETE
jgi:hypothetical protein